MSSYLSPRLTSQSPSLSSSNETHPAEPLYQVKLLSALRSGNPALIHPFLAEIGKDKRRSADGDLDTGAAALHLGVRCGSVETVRLLLSHRAISPNGIHPPGSGITPLHLAASLGRADVVNLLLEQEGIDDTLRDANGKTCREVAKGKDVLRAIDDSRAFLNASFRSLLRTYILSPTTSQPHPSLLALLSSPRICLVNISYLDDDSGTTLLHEAARRNDLRLIELAIRAGADVFVRDRRGKMAYEGSGKDERVRVFLRQFANHDTTLIQQSPLMEPPTLKGYLNKYTNVAKGYNTRWFVLKGGIFSYYRHQEDETVASRGSISMKTAILKRSPGGEHTRFEVHSMPSRGHHQSGVQKWYLKANHPVEAARWTQAIGQNIEWHRREVDNDGRRSGESDSSGLKASLQSTYLHSHSHKSSLVLAAGSVFKRKRNESERGSFSSSFAEVPSGDASPNMGGEVEQENRQATDTDVDAEERNDDSSSESTKKTPPYDVIFALHGNSAAAQMELTSQLLSNLSLPPNVPTRTVELKNALKDSFDVVHGLLNEYVQMVKEREEWWRKQLEKERERQTLWEESLATVVKEGEALERELRTRSRKRGSKFFDANYSGPDGAGTLRQRPSAIYATSAAPAVPEEKETLVQEYFPIGAVASASSAVEGLPGMTPTPTASSLLAQQQRRLQQPAPPPIVTSPTGMIDSDSLIDTDDEDEFFDAIESNTLPNLIVNEALTSSKHDKTLLISASDIRPYVGYTHLRDRLRITSDNRPSTSLWSVLKHSIGKDLTKISFPVFFNEPTSMLQRMAEDMEFSECLDVACREEDAHRRLAFVAAFAMSNYSSTIGRIAKPFNPMLSETFEYVRIDKEYRYVSEQVSHHPPISACWAESPYWRYFGEVDAQNKFMGKSFEIRPTGVAHAELLIPEGYAGPRYPRAPEKFGKGKVLEHYSWKKVTTNVSGFILGSPTIDHYGDMIITNHRTQDQCILTFKPRGWRGKDAYEITGQVRDSSGIVTYEIAGRWNSQLIARAVGTGSGFLHPDVTVVGPSSPSFTPEYILLWRNSDKPPAPFNLTPFAITLNDCPEDTLKPYLCPTDCRLRPDQRAFENGEYERANELKNAQEELQRVTRKAREDGRLPPHRPRWFSSETDGDTGERVWAPLRADDGTVEYWAQRDKIWRQGGNKEWENVDPIFVQADT